MTWRAVAASPSLLVDQTPPARREDLVFIQNGMLQPWHGRVHSVCDVIQRYLDSRLLI